MLRAERALAAFRKAHGDAHASVAQALNGLGTILIAKGDAPAATPLLREALATTRALYGDDHPRVAVVAGNLAKARAAQGDAAEATALLREALPILRRAYGDEHDLTRDVQERLGALARELSQEPN